MQKEKFNTKAKKKDTNKLEANKLFTRQAVQNLGKALILDAETLITTNFLSKRGFKNITVPNPYVYDKIKKDKRIIAKDQLVGNYIASTSIKFSAVWLDYCCTFDGNQTDEIVPQDDIIMLFNRRLLTDNSTFAVTFAYRTHERVAYTGETEDRVRKCITNEARKNGYVAIPERKFAYTGMYLLIYRVYKQ